MILWAVCSLIGAAILAPWFYLWGKQLAATCEREQLPAIIEWLGAACGRAKLDRYFNRAMLFSALCLMPLVFRRIRAITQRNSATNHIIQLQALGTQRAWIHWLTAFLIAASILWITGTLLAGLGAFETKPGDIKIERLFTKCVLPAIGASFVEEWLFRGILLGLWLRLAKPASACIGSSLLFSFLHFLKPPHAAIDPTDPLSGFTLLGKILVHFAEPRFFVTDFATLTIVGLILCWARLRTQSLWFPIGLHAGWVFAYGAFNLIYQHVAHPLHPWGVGNNLRSGFIPMIALLLTACLCHFILKRLTRPTRHANDSGEPKLTTESKT